jgi:hypothetical protein
VDEPGCGSDLVVDLLRAGGIDHAALKEAPMARAGYRIFDADTHIIEPAEPIEEYLTMADRAKLAALGPLVERAPAKAGMSRYRIGKRPALNRRLGSRERVEPPSAAARGAKDGGTPWDVRWQGRPFRASVSASIRTRESTTWTSRASTST